MTLLSVLDEPSTLLLVIVTIIVIMFAVNYYFLRYTFSLKRQLWNQQQQLRLLIKIAKKLDPEDNDLKWIDESNAASLD